MRPLSDDIRDLGSAGIADCGGDARESLFARFSVLSEALRRARDSHWTHGRGDVSGTGTAAVIMALVSPIKNRLIIDCNAWAASTRDIALMDDNDGGSLPWLSSLSIGSSSAFATLCSSPRSCMTTL
jgi:hypothetical protein